MGGFVPCRPAGRTTAPARPGGFRTLRRERWSAVTVRSVCRQAELNNRYFMRTSPTPTNFSVPLRFRGRGPDRRADPGDGGTTGRSRQTAGRHHRRAAFQLRRSAPRQDSVHRVQNQPGARGARAVTQDQLRKSVLHDTPVSSTTDRVADLVSRGDVRRRNGGTGPGVAAGHTRRRPEAVVQAAVELLMPSVPAPRWGAGQPSGWARRAPWGVLQSPVQDLENPLGPRSVPSSTPVPPRSTRRCCGCRRRRSSDGAAGRGR